MDKTKPLDEDNPQYLPNKSPWLFLIALEATLRTFVKAGSYQVPNKEAEPVNGTAPMVVNVARGPIEEHLANARNFILE